MSVTQFAMVEELAFLVKDNLSSKHLVLSTEEAFINFLQEDTSSDGILELQPMNSYNRLLVHRLADIFGFAHQSVGEGDDRHLVLERCPETSIPSILVSDILWQYDEPEVLTASRQLLAREQAQPGEEALTVSKTTLPSLQLSLKEREAAYSAARERIFAEGVGVFREPVKQKPRTVPVVARRMIAHALGQKVNSHNEDATIGDHAEHVQQSQDKTYPDDKGKVASNSRSEAYQETVSLSGQNTGVYDKTKSNNNDRSDASLSIDKNAQQGEAENKTSNLSRHGRNRNGVERVYSKEEHLGAAKRMFAHALGLQPTKDGSLSKCSERKKIDKA
ncbi:hypothetical protein SLEP1_g47801 [Rubroshorea leprosula]|uniref:R3H domain-containing protein n=1 Tax=Rubroshorea leprosula TaxID=152421 RepID=A0AAV5LUG5_9ROSI|nr:hypothetical protein SLEP1_g47801 [Rubroshorea leprosula]